MPCALPAPGTPGPSFDQIVEQDHSTVVKDVVSAVEQGHRAAPFGFEDGRPRGRVGVELLSISSAEFLPALHPMAEPPPQLRAGGDLLHPRIRAQGLLLHASRPEALHQNPPAVSARGMVICALDPKHRVLPPIGYTCLWSSIAQPFVDILGAGRAGVSFLAKRVHRYSACIGRFSRVGVYARTSRYRSAPAVNDEDWQILRRRPIAHPYHSRQHPSRC